MKFKVINNLYTDENTYIVYDENGIGFVIDPGNSDKEITEECEKLGINIDKILITHSHYDHVEFLEPLREKTKAQLVCGAKCAENLKNKDVNLTEAVLGRKINFKDPEIVVEDGQEIKIGDIEVKCIYTPGHTDGCFCYLAEDILFAGDTLFLRNCGRWDLPTGNMSTLLKSVKEKLYVLDDKVQVYSGHGGKTTIGYEKKYNLIISNRFGVGERKEKEDK